MRKPSSAAVLCLVGMVLGVAVGAGTVHLFHARRDSSRRQMFEQRQRCAGLADGYLKQEVAKGNESTFVERVDFSAARNSCIASTLSFSPAMQQYSVVDLLTKEQLSGDWCSPQEEIAPYCGGGRNIALMRERDAAFERALTSGAVQAGKAR